MARYGGNTACVEVRCGNRIVIFDGGSGLRALGNELVKNRWPIKADIFYSHCHMDHVCGMPFFAPVDRASTTLRLWAGNLLPRHNLRQTFGQIFSAPFFPDDTFQRLALSAEFHDFRAGETLTPHPDIVIRSAPLVHPGGSTGYRLEHGGRAIAYVTDTEHKPDDLDKRVIALAKDADVLIYDCTYTREEHASHLGWGHSTWQEGVRLADAASAKALAIFHHDPGHDDSFLDRVGAEARALRPGTFVAAEGTTMRLG
jgi:phosphoribosyl 1,2-cyclic phosphodiesterase